MTWPEYVTMFGIGLSCGFPVALLALAIRRIRLTLTSSFVSAVHGS